MGTRIFFMTIALGFVVAGMWAYHHDDELHRNAMQVNPGDADEVVRELLGNPSSEGPCGSLTAVPATCANEYVYKYYYYSIFNPQYEVVWFDSAGKALGEQHVQRP